MYNGTLSRNKNLIVKVGEILETGKINYTTGPYGKKFEYEGAVLDTLLCSRLIFANRTELDFKYKQLPPKLYGRHSIEAWGYRLGLR